MPSADHRGVQFTAPDLSAIARQLDEEEAQYDEANTGQSTNMDDTGELKKIRHMRHKSSHMP